MGLSFRFSALLMAAVLATGVSELPDCAVGRVIDVTEFGARGQDNADDTDAIEQAVAEAKRLERARRPENGSLIGSSPVVYFPAGIYHLSRQIDLSGLASLRGDSGKSIIQWVDAPDQDPSVESVMFRVHAYTNRIENLKFLGATTHLLFHNDNVNQTTIDIEGCEFQHARGFAVRAVPSGDAGHLSTFLTIRNSKFIFNHQCLETFADYTAIVDCWVELRQPQMIDGAAFVNRSGHLFFDRMLGVPCADVTKAPKGGRNLDNARWIDNYGHYVTAINTRFGAEGGGIPIVYNFDRFEPKYPWVNQGAQIVITQSAVYTGSTRRPMGSVIVLHALPQMVVLRDNRGPVNNPVFKAADGFDVSAELASLGEGRRYLQYIIRDNLTHPPADLAGTVLEPLRPFVRP